MNFKRIVLFISLLFIFSISFSSFVFAFDVDSFVRSSNLPTMSDEFYTSSFDYGSCKLTLVSNLDPDSPPIVLDLKDKQTYSLLEFQKYWPYDSDCLRYDYFSVDAYKNMPWDNIASGTTNVYGSRSFGDLVEKIIFRKINYSVFFHYIYSDFEYVQSDRLRDARLRRFFDFNKIFDDLFPSYNIRRFNIDGYEYPKTVSFDDLNFDVSDDQIVLFCKGEPLFTLDKNSVNNKVGSMLVETDLFSSEHCQLEIDLNNSYLGDLSLINKIPRATISVYNHALSVNDGKPFVRRNLGVGVGISDIYINNGEVYYSNYQLGASILDNNFFYQIVSDDVFFKIEDDLPSFLNHKGVVPCNATVYISDINFDSKIFFDLDKNDSLEIITDGAADLITIESQSLPNIFLNIKTGFKGKLYSYFSETDNINIKETNDRTEFFTKPSIIDVITPDTEQIIILSNDQQMVRRITTLKELGEVKHILNKPFSISRKIDLIYQGTVVRDSEYIEKLLSENKNIKFSGLDVLSPRDVLVVRDYLAKLPISLKDELLTIDFSFYNPDCENAAGCAYPTTHHMWVKSDQIIPYYKVIPHESAHLHEFTINELISYLNDFKSIGVSFPGFKNFQEQNLDLIKQLKSFKSVRNVIEIIEKSKEPHGYYGADFDSNFTGDEACVRAYGCSSSVEDIATLVEVVSAFTDPLRDSEEDSYISTRENYERAIRMKYSHAYDLFEDRNPPLRVRQKMDLLWRLKFIEDDQMNKLISSANRVEFKTGIEELSDLVLQENFTVEKTTSHINTGISEDERKAVVDFLLKKRDEQPKSVIIQDIDTQDYVDSDLLLALFATIIQNKLSYFNSSLENIDLENFFPDSSSLVSRLSKNIVFNLYSDKKDPTIEIAESADKFKFVKIVYEGNLLDKQDKLNFLKKETLSMQELYSDFSSLHLGYLKIPVYYEGVQVHFMYLDDFVSENISSELFTPIVLFESNNESPVFNTLKLILPRLELTKKAFCETNNIEFCNEDKDNMIFNTAAKTELEIPLIMFKPVLTDAYKLWLLEQYLYEFDSKNLNITQLGNLYANNFPVRQEIITKNYLDSSFFISVDKPFGVVLSENYNYIKGLS